MQINTSAWEKAIDQLDSAVSGISKALDCDWNDNTHESFMSFKDDLTNGKTTVESLCSQLTSSAAPLNNINASDFSSRLAEITSSVKGGK